MDALNRIENSINKIPEGGQPFITNRSGLTLLLDPSSLVDWHIIHEGYWEHGQVTTLMRAVEKAAAVSDPVFLDIGAYWGYYSLHARLSGA